MSLSRRQLRVALVVGMVLGIIAAPVIAATLSSVIPTSGTVPIGAPDGPTVNLDGNGNVSLTDFTPTDQSVEIVTIDGNLTASANGPADFQVSYPNIEGTYTNITDINATQHELQINPADKPAVNVSGEATVLDFRTAGVDNGNIDVVTDGVDGTSADLTIRGLPADTRIGALDTEANQAVDVVTTNANGAATITVKHQTGTTLLEFPNGDIEQSWSDTDRHIKLVAAPRTTGAVTYLADNGPTLALSSGTTAYLADPFPFTSTVNVTTDAGDLEATGGSGTQLAVEPTNLEGEFTNVTNVVATGSTLQMDPGDKTALGLNGDATSADWRDFDPTDTTLDAIVDGPSGSTDVTFSGATDGQVYTASNENGKPYDVATGDSFDQVTFDVGHSTSEITVAEGDTTDAPVQTNATPNTLLQQEPTEYSVDITDTDFGADEEVTVDIDVDGTDVSTQTITMNQTVTATIPSQGLLGGEHTWTVNATDAFGNTILESYTYSTPDTLFLRNETQPEQLINDSINADIRFFGEEQVFTRSTGSGKLNLTGLPVSQELVVEVSTDGNWTDRTVYFYEGGIYEQQSVYLLNTTIYDTIETRFYLNDPTGTYDENSVLQVRRPINRSGNTTYRTIHADQFGVEGITPVLQADQRYKMVITTIDGGSLQDLGPYRSTVTESIEIQPSAPGVEFDEYTETWGYGSTVEDGTLTWSYFDNEQATNRLTVWIH